MNALVSFRFRGADQIDMLPGIPSKPKTAVLASKAHSIPIRKEERLSRLKEQQRKWLAEMDYEKMTQSQLDFEPPTQHPNAQQANSEAPNSRESDLLVDNWFSLSYNSDHHKEITQTQHRDASEDARLLSKNASLYTLSASTLDEDPKTLAASYKSQFEQLQKRYEILHDETISLRSHIQLFTNEMDTFAKEECNASKEANDIEAMIAHYSRKLKDLRALASERRCRVVKIAEALDALKEKERLASGTLEVVNRRKENARAIYQGLSDCLNLEHD